MGLRSNGYQDLQPTPYFGNAMSIAVVQPPSLDKAPQPDGSGLREIFAAAACAVRLATQAFRADVAGGAKQLMAALPALVESESLRNPDMNPFKGCCADVVSWRNLYNNVDFGKGPPSLTLGAALPSLINICWVMEGPDGDGVFCTLWSTEEESKRLQTSQVLHQIAPEASFVQAHSKFGT